MPMPMKESMTDVVIKEEPVDPEEENQAVGEEYETNGDGEDSAHHADDDGHEIDQVGDVDDVCVILDDDEEEEEDAEEYDHEKNGNEEAIEGDAAEEGEGPTGDEEMQEENTGDTVNMDNDESINLTIGEDEQKLLHDEVFFIIYVNGRLLNYNCRFRPLTTSLLSRVSIN